MPADPHAAAAPSRDYARYRAEAMVAAHPEARRVEQAAWRWWWPAAALRVGAAGAGPLIVGVAAVAAALDAPVWLGALTGAAVAAVALPHGVPAWMLPAPLRRARAADARRRGAAVEAAAAALARGDEGAARAEADRALRGGAEESGAV